MATLSQKLLGIRQKVFQDNGEKSQPIFLFRQNKVFLILAIGFPEGDWEVKAKGGRKEFSGGFPYLFPAFLFSFLSSPFSQ